MPVDYNCYICHGDPETSMICSRCRWDEDVAFQQIADLQARVRYLEKHTGYKYSELNEKVDEHNIIFQPPKLTFEELIDDVDGRSLQTVFRQIDDRTLAAVLYSLQTPERVAKIKKNVSKNHFERLLDYITEGYFGTVPERLEPYREEFMKVIRQLEEMGEIVVASRDNEESHEFRYVSGPPIDWEKYRQDQKKQLEEQDKIRKEWKIKVGLEKPNE